MTRPDWCDKKTWEAADDLMDAVLGDGIMQGAPNSQAAIARALLAAEQRGAEREREACALLIEEGFERVVGKRYRDDGGSSKNDLCIHHHPMYEDCEQCAAAAIRGRKA